jgi:hypothetical protein
MIDDFDRYWSKKMDQLTIQHDLWPLIKSVAQESWYAGRELLFKELLKKESYDFEVKE